MFNKKYSGLCACPQGWHIACLISLFSHTVQADLIPTIVNGEVIYEFGDYGKAPNQYPVKVGELNVISSVQVFRVGGKLFITKPIKSSTISTDSSDKRIINNPIQ